MEKRNIRVQPIYGKFCSVTSHGKIIRIWLVDPATNKQGTEVSYDDAIELLSLRHPMICLSQEKGKDGKYIEQLSDEEWELIDKKRLEAQNKISANTLQTSSSGTDSTLQKLVETQAEVINTQLAQITTMQTQFAEMQATMAELLKSSKKTSKKDKTDSAE